MPAARWIEIDTPDGLLSCTWPAGQTIYDGMEAVAVEPPQDPGPHCTLNGKPVTVEQARTALRRMAAQGLT